MLRGKLIQRCSKGLEDFIPVQDIKITEKGLVEDAEKTAINPFFLFPGLGNLGVGKCHCMLFHFHCFVSLMHFGIASHQHDLIKISPLLRHRFGIDANKRLQFENIEVPDVVADVIRYPIKFSFVNLLNGFCLFHVAH